MTKEQARQLGVKEGRNAAESIWTDTPYQRLAEVAEKYRHKAAWEKRSIRYQTSESEWNKSTKRWDIEQTQIPDELHDTFKKAYIAAGMAFIENEVQHALRTGYLQET